MSQPPRLRKTGALDLLIPLFVVGIAVYFLLRTEYGDLPPLGYFVPVPLLVLAVAELIAARRVRAAVRHHPEARPMQAITIARCVALGKASSLVGAGVVGAAGALMLHVLPEASTVTAAANDARVGGFLLGIAVLLVVAGLLLERAGVDPGSSDRDG